MDENRDGGCFRRYDGWNGDVTPPNQDAGGYQTAYFQVTDNSPMVDSVFLCSLGSHYGQVVQHTSIEGR